jgi:hypothetical protein
MDTTCLVKGQTTTLNYEISTMWEMNPKKTPQKKLPDLMGAEKVTRHNKLYHDNEYYCS